MTMNHSSDGSRDPLVPVNRAHPPTRTFPPPTNAQSEMERLRNVSRAETNISNNILKMYGTERSVARLAAAPISQSLVLKGGYLLREVLPAGVRRTTLDADFYSTNDRKEEVIAAITEALTKPHDQDHCAFHRDSMEVNPIQGEEGIRITYKGSLGVGSIDGMIDIGFTAAVIPSPERRELRPMLRHATPFHVLAYPIAVVAAEKYETILSRGLLNTRLKDYYDLSCLARYHRESPEILRPALEATCTQRGTLLATTRPPGLMAEYTQNPQMQKAWRSMTTKGSGEQGLTLEQASEDIWAMFAEVVDPSSGSR